MVVVGALGFSLGSGYWVELVQLTEQDGTPHVIGVRPGNPGGQGDLSFTPHTSVFNRSLRLSARDIFYRFAVRDYLQALTSPDDCAAYCYRAIESIKSSFVFKTGKDRWDEMHAALGTSREMIETSVKTFADPIRHGNRINAMPTDMFIRWRMYETTRHILNSYLDLHEPVAA